MEQRVYITMGDSIPIKMQVKNEVPIWFAKSTVIAEDSITSKVGYITFFLLFILDA